MCNFARLFQKHGSRMKCSACNVVVHQNCINILADRVRFSCKPTFRDVGVRQYREQTTIQHHWVHRRSEKGKCRHCGKVTHFHELFSMEKPTKSNILPATFISYSWVCSVHRDKWQTMGNIYFFVFKQFLLLSSWNNNCVGKEFFLSNFEIVNNHNCLSLPSWTCLLFN